MNLLVLAINKGKQSRVIIITYPVVCNLISIAVLTFNTPFQQYLCASTFVIYYHTPLTFARQSSTFSNYHNWLFLFNITSSPLCWNLDAKPNNINVPQDTHFHRHYARHILWSEGRGVKKRRQISLNKKVIIKLPRRFNWDCKINLLKLQRILLH